MSRNIIINRNKRRGHWRQVFESLTLLEWKIPSLVQVWLKLIKFQIWNILEFGNAMMQFLVGVSMSMRVFWWYCGIWTLFSQNHLCLCFCFVLNYISLSVFLVYTSSVSTLFFFFLSFFLAVVIVFEWFLYEHKTEIDELQNYPRNQNNHH
jgi:hypothetical protein